MSYRLGVDLGTTFTAAAVANGGPPTMLGLGNRALQVPSVLYLPPDGDLVVGEAAERRGLTDPTRLVREFKRRIGDHVPILVAGVPYSPQSLTAQLLQWVVQAGTEQMGEPPSRTILTYPANWGPYKRELLSQVVEIADVGDVVTCSEPEAAAVQYAAKSRVQPGARIAMYDLGGGTFDTCVLEKSDSGFVMLGEPIGIEHLGGIDFDDAVFQHVLESVNDQLPGLDPAEEGLQAGLARLRRDCVDAKEALSSDVQAIVPVTLPGLSTSVRLTRSELEELLRPPLEQTVAALGRALRSASVEPSDLHAIVLVGGGSRIPLVRELLQQAYPVRTALDTHPKHDVALGAVQVDAPARPDSRPVPRPLPAPGPRATPAGPVTPATPKPTPKPRPTSKPTPRSRLAPDPRLMPDPRLTPGPRPTPEPPPAPEPRPAPEPQATPEPAPEPEAQALPVPPAPEPLTEVLPTTPVPPLPVQPAGSPSPRHDRTGGGRRPRLPGAIRPRQLAIGGGAAALALVVAIGLLNRGGDEGGPGPGSTTPAATAAPGDLPASTPLTAQQLLVPMKVNDAGDTDIFLADIGISSPIKRLTSIPGPDTAPALSPDRRSAIFVHIEGKRTLWVMAADGSGARELFDPAPPECVNAFRPAWSPADPTLLAMACEDAAGTRGLYLVRIDGKELLKLPVEQPLMDDPAFSPDGRTLSYWAGAESPLDGGSIYTLEIEGGSPRRLTEVAPGIDADPAWSPDGSTIAFRRRVADGTSHGNFEIFTVPSDGSGSARGLIEGPADDQDPSWSPSGDQLAVKSNRLQSGGGTGRARVWLVRADGTDSRLLWSTGANGEQSAPAWTRR